MRIEYLKGEKIFDFISYCKKHKLEVDDSYLYDDHLNSFKPNDENPTYVIIDNKDRILGAASLVIDDYNKRSKRGRFRIFHIEVNNLEYYKKLMENILNHTKDLEQVFLFVPVNNTFLMETMKNLNFIIERYSFILVRDIIETPKINLDEGYEIKSLKVGIDEVKFSIVRNAGFATVKGNETAITPEMVYKYSLEADYIEGGIMILYHNQEPVGVVRCTIDEYEDQPILNIGSLAIIPEYQGKGLGKTLIRASIKLAKEKLYSKVILCVNADNEKAKSLYIKENFIQVDGFACFIYDLS